MKHLIPFLLLGLILTACSSSEPESVQQKSPERKDISSWVADLPKEHPDWFTCGEDRDCTPVPSECGTVCRGLAVNYQAYSDCVVAQGKACQGNQVRQIAGCRVHEAKCTGGLCTFRYLE